MKLFSTLLVGAALLLAPTTLAAPPLPLAWHDTGITATGSFMCLDDGHPGMVFVTAPEGTVAYDWQPRRALCTTQDQRFALDRR